MRVSCGGYDDEKVKNFFILTKLISLSDNERRKRDFINSFFKNLMLMIETIKDYKEIVEKLKLNLGETHIKLEDSRKLPLNENTIDGIITSPPYSIALDYIINDIHSLKELLFDDIEKLKENFIGLRGRKKEKVDLYNEDIYICLKEMYRVLKPNKFLVIILGNAKLNGQEINSIDFVINKAIDIGFKLVESIDKIIYGLYNIMQKEKILIFKKEAI